VSAGEVVVGVDVITAAIKKGNPASWGKPGRGEGFDLGDRADAEHREGGREILRNRREEGET